MDIEGLGAKQVEMFFNDPILPVKAPANEHPGKRVMGFDCPRSEVSGRRLWGWAAAEFGTAGQFFNDYFVVNYCPLIFLEETGRNRTPDKIPASEMAVVEAACDDHLKRVIEVLDPVWLIGVGGFAENRLREVAGDRPETSLNTMLARLQAEEEDDGRTGGVAARRGLTGTRQEAASLLSASGSSGGARPRAHRDAIRMGPSRRRS
mgnify:CR=1 FL=1